MGALNIILSTQLVIIIFLSSSVLLSSCTTLPNPPPPSSQDVIHNEAITGIMTRLTFIANGGVSAQEPVQTLDELTVSKLNKLYPNIAFVRRLFEEVQGGRALNKSDFVKFLSQNSGFLAKALKLCFTYQQDTSKPVFGFHDNELEEKLSLPKQDAIHLMENTMFMTWEKAAERIYLFGRYVEANPKKTSRKPSTTGCC